MAARQLAYHRLRFRWMEECMEANAAALETYLVAQGKETAVLPGGYTVSLTGEGETVVSKLQDSPEYEQLKLFDWEL